jgi:predicted phosphodiesterase
MQLASAWRLLSLLLLACCAIARAQTSAESFSFGIIADMPYFAFERPVAQAIVREMDEQDLAFVVHAGDIKSGWEPCSDAIFMWNRKLFDSSRHPLIYVPGDNEWVDCHRASNGGFDPEERLRRLREIFHTGNRSLGVRTIELERQSCHSERHAAYREHTRWQHGVVLFVALNIPGSNNNLGRTPAADTEHHTRSAAAIAWLVQSFELANQRLSHGIVIAIHGNPQFARSEAETVEGGYDEFLKKLEAETIAFAKPVLLIHGDTHFQRIDQPMIERESGRLVKHFTRVEAFGSPFLGWVKVTVDPARPELFAFEPRRYEPKPREGTE